jgi:hypothetical protein
MATKKKTQRAAGSARVVEKKPVEVATPSLVESSTVETLVQVLSQEELEKAKALAFTLGSSIIAKNNSEVTKNNAQARFFGTLAVLVDVAVKVVNKNLDVIDDLFRYKVKKVGGNLRSQHFSEVAATQAAQAVPATPVAPQPHQQRPQQRPQQARPRAFQGKNPRPAGQPGQRPLAHAQRPLTQTLADKLQAAGHVPPAELTPPPAPAEQQTQQTQ